MGLQPTSHFLNHALGESRSRDTHLEHDIATAVEADDEHRPVDSWMTLDRVRLALRGRRNPRPCGAGNNVGGKRDETVRQESLGRGVDFRRKSGRTYTEQLPAE